MHAEDNYKDELTTATYQKSSRCIVGLENFDETAEDTEGASDIACVAGLTLTLCWFGVVEVFDRNVGEIWTWFDPFV